MKKYNIPTSLGGFLDYISILQIKLMKDVSLDESTQKVYNNGLHIIYKYGIEMEELYDELRHINELIWWCMDQQREYSLESIGDRREIACIVAVLNDKRDEIKKKINEKFTDDENKLEQKLYKPNLIIGKL